MSESCEIHRRGKWTVNTELRTCDRPPNARHSPSAAQCSSPSFNDPMIVTLLQQPNAHHPTSAAQCSSLSSSPMLVTLTSATQCSSPSFSRSNAVN